MAVVPFPGPNPPATFPGPDPVCSVCSCHCCQGMPTLNAHELFTDAVLGTLSAENWHTVAGGVGASPTQEPFERWLRDNPTYFLGETGGFGGPVGMCVDFGSGSRAAPAAWTQRGREPKSGDSLGVRVGCRKAGDGKGIRISVGTMDGASGPSNGVACPHNCGSQAWLPNEYQLYPGPIRPATSAAADPGGCDYHAATFGAYTGRHLISDYGFYLATHPICGSGVARKRPINPSLPDTAGPLNAPGGSSPPYPELPCAICARPVVGCRPVGPLFSTGTSVGWYVPNQYIGAYFERGDGLPPEDSGSVKWDVAHLADGTNIIPADFTVSVTPLDVQTWRLGPNGCAENGIPLWEYRCGLPVTATASVNLPEAWAWHSSGFPEYIPTLVKLSDAMTLTRTVTGFFRGRYSEQSWQWGHWASGCQAYVANDTSTTCPADGCSRRFVYSPGQIPFTVSTGAHPDPSAPVVGWNVGPYPVTNPEGGFLFNTNIEVRASLFANLADITEGACGLPPIDQEETPLPFTASPEETTTLTVNRDCGCGGANNIRHALQDQARRSRGNLRK